MAKILIVEDNALNIKLFCDLLAAHGHQPEAVTDSRLALDAARNFDPDLVITGHGPAMRGPEMRAALHDLARDFDRIAMPEKGRYVQKPARAEDGSAYRPA